MSDKLFENKEEHPSYGQLSISRVSTNSRTPLYGTSNECREYIKITIMQSELHRDLHRSWHFGTNPFIEVIMSPAQFAEAITSLNIGDGVPVTITRVRTHDGTKEVYAKIPQPPFRDERDLFDKEFKADVDKVMKDANSLVKQIKELAGQKTVSKKALSEMVSNLEMLQQNIESNMPFIAKSFNEFIGKAVSSAKIEIESFVDNKIRHAGLEALLNNAPESKLLLAHEEGLDSPEDQVRDESKKGLDG